MTRITRRANTTINETSNIVLLRQPVEIGDPMTDIRRAAERQLSTQAIEAEVESERRSQTAAVRYAFW